MGKVFVIGVVFLLSQLGLAQQRYDHLNQLWFGYYSNVKLSQRWAVNSDFQGRTTDWYNEWSQVLVRSGLAYKFNDKFALTVGFADFLYFEKGNKATRNEYRPWQELAVSDHYNAWKITHRFRYEQRFFQHIVNDELSGGYTSNHRFRYKLDFQRTIWKKENSETSLALQFSNELMINAGKSIVYNYFDQNRTAASLLFTANKNFTLQLQYMNIIQQLSNGTTINQANVIRINIYHTISVSKQ
jgi:hypothetical protein